MTKNFRKAFKGEWTVRPFRPMDAGDLSRIYQAAVRTLAVRHYPPDQIAAWLSIAPAPETIAVLYMDGRTALVCTKDGQPVAFSDHDAAGHIRFLYCDPASAGLGVANHLMTAVERSACRQGIDCLSSEASEAALGCFRRHGFKVIARRDLDVAGVAIHNYAVEKRRADQSPATTAQGPIT